MTKRDNADIQRRLTDAEVPKWTSLDPGQATRIRIVRRMAMQLPPGRVLDIGCGSGLITAPLGEKHRVSGMDVSEVAVAEASRNGLHAVVGNAEDGIPFEDSAFDIVIAGETIEHIVRTDWFLHEVNRVTKIGGSLILTTPNVASLTSLGMMLLLDLPPYMAARYRSPHVRDFTIRTLKAAVSNHGYRTIEVRGAELMFPLVGAVLPSIGYVLPRLSPQIILHAEKVADSHFDEADEIELSGHP